MSVNLILNPGVTHDAGSIWWPKGWSFPSPPTTSLPGPGRTRGRRPFWKWWEAACRPLSKSYRKRTVNILSQFIPRNWRELLNYGKCWLLVCPAESFLWCWPPALLSCGVVNAEDEDGEVSKLAEVPAAKRKGVRRPQPKLDSHRYLKHRDRNITAEDLNLFKCRFKKYIELLANAIYTPGCHKAWK